jgi:hypothetical protein
MFGSARAFRRARPEEVPGALLDLFAGQARSRSGGGRPRPGRGPFEQGTAAGQLPGRPGRLLISCVRAAGQELKFAIAGAQPTPWIHTFWMPAMSGAMSPTETIICAVKDSSLPSPAR